MPVLRKKRVAEYSALYDVAASGELGKEAQCALEGIELATKRYVTEDLRDKTASASQTDYNIYDENAARRARLNTLLRKQ